MIAVVSFVAVMVVVTTAVATSVLSAQTFTSGAKASVQSQAAAEAGIAAARAGLASGTCGAHGGTYSSAAGTTPAYVATVYTRTGANWVASACPASVAVETKIISVGSASTAVLGGSASGETTTIEAVLSTASSQVALNPSGPAIYMFRSDGVGGGARVFSDDAEASVIVKQGDLTCTGGAAVGSSEEIHVVVDGGNLRVDAGCRITGNAWASGSVTMPGGPDVGGNVVGSSLAMSGGSDVGGSVWLTGALTMDGGVVVSGNATANSLTMNNGAIGGTAVIAGTANLTGGGSKIGGNLTAQNVNFTTTGEVGGNAWITTNTAFNGWNGWIKGALTTRTASGLNIGKIGPAGAHGPNAYTTVTGSAPGASPYNTNGSAPDRPIAPNWVDFDYDSADWTALGFGVYTMPTSCTFAWYPPADPLQTAVSSFAGAPGVIDARACTGGVVIDGGRKLTFSNDLVIIAPKITVTGGGGFTNANASRLWLITPDTVADAQPTCSAGMGLTVDGGATVPANLDVMFYTPCEIKLEPSGGVHGQVFAGRANIASSTTITYSALGLPGVNLDTGESNGATATEADRVVVLQRTLDD